MKLVNVFNQNARIRTAIGSDLHQEAKPCNATKTMINE
jgi:hypothetical protein